MRPPGLHAALMVEKGLNQLSSDIINFHAPVFDFNIDAGSDDPTNADQKVPTRPDTALQLHSKSSQY